eukprot:CAMPEP_0201520536 /NCGR_PEP_ID=MMETSP0161_2-20130828/11748_1 /ASSEMBLY_ACC=CAM_ASM_000251 /TAXON_ID=180227 /ORGANISM="Neoparamoeba aestuarina, Strain SoJaBio B1-5/56/2" /LENGTH=145 /DNA_ID=CAMNT_0047918943 /DNA_START=54 /DNA_END=491 /DNA_ORIENTATION=+
MAVSFSGFTIGMNMDEAEKVALNMYAGKIDSRKVRAVRPSDNAHLYVTILIEREDEKRIDNQLISLFSDGVNGGLRKIIFDKDTMDACLGCSGLNDKDLAASLSQKYGAPEMTLKRQSFGPDKRIGVTEDGTKFLVDRHTLTIEK